MAKLREIIVDYINNRQKEREVGRYYSSELYKIIKKEITPENFFEKKKVAEEESKLISEGIAIEDYISKMFQESGVKVECQVKKEVEIAEGIILVAKPDFHFGDFLVELKRPLKVYDAIPEKWIYQLEAYYRAFYLPVKLWQCTYPLTFKEIEYIPSEARWKKIKRELMEFDKKLKLIVKNRGVENSGLDKKI